MLAPEASTLSTSMNLAAVDAVEDDPASNQTGAKKIQRASLFAILLTSICGLVYLYTDNVVESFDMTAWESSTPAVMSLTSFSSTTDDNADWDMFDYSTYDAKNDLLGIYTSKHGRIVITSDTEGYIYRSKDYGASWSKAKSIYIEDDDTYASIYGLVMDEKGKKMIAGTGYYSNYESSDYGKTWTEVEGTPTCGIMAANYRLTRMACIGGVSVPISPAEQNIYFSTDGGVTFEESSSLTGSFTGLIGKIKHRTNDRTRHYSLLTAHFVIDPPNN
jgi:hypothetical protein